MSQRFTQQASGFMRWILRADQAVSPHSDEEIIAEINRNYPWNFAVNLVDGASFWFGVGFISSTTIVPLYVSKLTSNPLAIGVAAAIAQSAWFLPQLFTANSVEHLPRRKPVVINLGLFTERLPIFLLVVSAALALVAPEIALALFLIGYAWHGLGAGVIATAWQDLLARCFPVERRGRFFGTTMFVGASAGIGAAAMSVWLLENYAYPLNFVIMFSLAAIAILISWGFLALTREPELPMQAPPRSSRQYWGQLPSIIKRDDNFRHFLIARMLLALGAMGTGFIAVTAVSRWAVPDSTAGYYTAAYLLGQTAGNLAFGLLADHRGHKLSLEISALSSILAFSLAWLAPDPEWYLLVFVLLGLSSAAIIVSGILVVMEFSRPERRPTYAGLANTAVGCISLLGPLAGAWLIGYSSDLLFFGSAAISLLSLVLMRWWVHEPRHTLPATLE